MLVPGQLVSRLPGQPRRPGRGQSSPNELNTPGATRGGFGASPAAVADSVSVPVRVIHAATFTLGGKQCIHSQSAGRLRRWRWG
jgi:hypothetical protein